MKYNIALIGAGTVGKKRAEALRHFKNCRLAVVADLQLAAARQIADQFGGEATDDWRAAVKRDDVAIVIVSTDNSALAAVSTAALQNGKHLLCEKPMGRNVREVERIVAAGRKSKRLIKVGFNLRFHPGIWRAKKELDKGIIGTTLFIRARYGHGGRIGMEKEWRLQKKIAGGGELLDQGTHIIDLCRWFGGEFTEVVGMTDAKFWQSDVEDNAMVVMRNKTVTASFHVSTANWGNVFSFEVFGDRGALIIDGLGGRYGQETLFVGIRRGPYNDLKTKRYLYRSDVDDSWRAEWRNFLEAIDNKSSMIGVGEDGLRAQQIVAAIYRSSGARTFIAA